MSLYLKLSVLTNSFSLFRSSTISKSKSKVTLISALLLILILSSCSSFQKLPKNKSTQESTKKNEQYQSPWEAKLKNAKALSYKNGKSDGIKEGEKKGYILGIDEGIEKGKEISCVNTKKELEVCENWLKTIREARDGSCSALVEEVRYSAKKQGYTEGHKVGYEKGEIEGKRKGKEEGRKIGYKEGYEEQLNYIISTRANQISLKDVDFQSTLDYESIIEQISKIDGKSEHDLKIYSSVLEKVHREILDYVSLKVDLNSEEKRDLLEEYEHIHNQITQSYYEQFKDLYYSRNIDSENSVEYFSEYQNVELFSKVLANGICTLVDLGLRFAKTNPMYAVARGILTGELCEILIVEVVGSVSDDMFKISLFREYNKLEIKLKEQSVNMIAELVVTEYERIERGYKKIEFLFSDASVKADVRTVLKLGFELKDFDLEIDHEKQEFIITLSQEPKVLGITQETKFLEIDTGFFVNIDEDDLNEIYGKLKRRAIKEAKRKGLDDLAKERVVLILKNIFYPVIALPHSQYKVLVKFGKSKEQNLFPYSKP